MAATHGVGVYGNAVGVVTPLDHKMAQLGLIAKTAANTIRAGVFWDGNTTIVSGKANMSLDVRAFTAVLSRGATAGAVLLSNDAVLNLTTGTTGATLVAPGSNSVYWNVFVWQREYSIDGTDSNPLISVLVGTPAASPSVPALTAYPGAISLATVLVPAGTTATNSGTTITQTAPFTANAGGMIPFRTTTERDAGSYQDGQLGWLINTHTPQAYNGSSWNTLVVSQGLTPVIPTSVASSGGSAAVGTNGAVTFTAVNAVNVNGCFTATYDNYTIIINNPTTSVANAITGRLRVAGTDDSSANYDQQQLAASSTTVSGAATLAATSWSGFSTGARAMKTVTFNVFSPFLAAQTFGDTNVRDADAAANLGLTQFTVRHRSATSFDGFTLTVSTGTATGTIRIYGWNNN